MDLSVIIVNYNVKFFLEQCLHSVYKSISGINGEVIVVDNNSVDGSCQMVREKFPETILIDNKKNLGFSKANNQGLVMAKGKYVLILNPDTVVEENTFRKCFEFMESHPKAGSLGVKMIDGKGNFLPESKRSLPTPLVSFFKIFGLASLFPKSKIFGKYHLGFLNKNQTHKVDILCGAFMFIRNSVLDETGYFDETFFMYGEDIDLSYRIILAGYENYYFPETTIIHYKGESTKKGSINYVVIFYKAMIIFARKHFSRRYAWFYSILIHLAIYLRASVSIVRRIFLTAIIPLSDAILIFAGFHFMEPFWEKYKFQHENYYPQEYHLIIVPGYILIWLSFLYFSGGYEKKTRPIDLLRGITFGSIFLLLIYALLPENLRYSRALMLFGAVWTFIVVFFNRSTLGYIFKSARLSLGKQKKRIVIVGSVQESQRVMTILKQVDIAPYLVGLVKWNGSDKNSDFMGDLSQIDEIIKVNRIDEIVFCGKDISSFMIIQTMLSVTDSSVEFKIAPQESMSIIGSNSINTAGELYVVHFNSLRQNVAKRKKRIFDFIVSVSLFISIPLTVFYVKNPFRFIRNIILVLFGIRSWVGFYKSEENNVTSTLPHLPEGILTPVPFNEERMLKKETIERLNLLYANDYKLLNDLSILFRDFRYLGK
jgi:O-antigen biosynthesis protein